MSCCGESPSSLPPSGPAGGVLTGQYPNPDLEPIKAADTISKSDSALLILANALCSKLQKCFASVFVKCDGSAHEPGSAIPTCEEMDAAIKAVSAPKLLDCNGASIAEGTHMATCAQVDDKIATAVGAIPADKFLQDVQYDPATHTMTFKVSAGGETFSVNLSELVPIVSGAGLQGDGTIATPVAIKLKPNGGLVVDPLGVTLQPAAAAAPATQAGTDLPTTIYGGRTALLAEPDGWFSIGGKKLPFWN